ncbi:MAG TPA: 4Fe-4S binding protein [Vicinamibacterales bacterium]|nr:4Fe-4S binding protein [Vicinamibacterales bacterium]
MSESWGDVLGPQALDLALLGVFIALVLVSFFRKSVWLKYVALAFAVGYMGFSKSHLISVVDVFGVIDRNLPIAKYNVSYYALGVFVVASTVLWGRLYCGRVCAFGALTQIMDAVLPKKLRIEPPAAIERRAAWIKYGLLAGVIVYYIVTHDLQVYRYVEPFWMFGLFGTTPMWIGLGALLVATIFVRNLYCRFLCPVGALLGLISNVTVFQIKRWSECKTCKICEKTCHWGAIRGPQIVAAECVRCDDCERLYLDQKKCPHWIILLKPVKARPSAATGAPAVPSTAV